MTRTIFTWYWFDWKKFWILLASVCTMQCCASVSALHTPISNTVLATHQVFCTPNPSLLLSLVLLRTLQQPWVVRYYNFKQIVHLPLYSSSKFRRWPIRKITTHFCEFQWKKYYIEGFAIILFLRIISQWHPS